MLKQKFYISNVIFFVIFIGQAGYLVNSLK